MHLDKKKITFSAIGISLLPQLCLAASTAAEEKGADYNTTLISLVGLILILLFVIGMLANTLKQLSFVVKDKNRKEKQAGSGIVKSLLLLVFLFSSAHSFAVTDEFKLPDVKFISGIPIMDFYLIISVIALELMVIFALTFYIHVMLKIMRNEPEQIAAAKTVIRKSWFWDKFNSASSIEKEKDILLDHDYDGIQELDNSLPPWWKYGFYVTIVVAAIYLYRFHISHDGMSQLDEYVEEMQKGEQDKAEYLAKSANNVDENTVVMLTSAGDIASGHDAFVKTCAACHLADGGGTVGPNLTDDYWLHGGSIKDIFKTIKYGWQEKGMKSWKDDYSPKQMQELASFIKTLKGTHPATPKAPQGELYIEAGQKTTTDSTKTDKVVQNK